MSGVTVFVAMAVLLLGACQAGSSTSANPSAPTSTESSAASEVPASASAAASVRASHDPNETIDRSTTNGILPPDSLALVMVEGLRVRDLPSLAGNVTGSLAFGTRVAVLGGPHNLGPITADGFDWYLVEYRTGEDPDTGGVGYAAAGDAAASFLATLRPRCEAAADVLLTGFEQLTCYGGASLTITGTYGCGGCGGVSIGTFEPGWLADPTQYFQIVTVQPGMGLGRLHIHNSPESGLEFPTTEGSIIRAVGHYDDPAAATCRIAPGGEEPADPRAAVMYCRERFVIDSYEVIGTDPSFPS